MSPVPAHKTAVEGPRRPCAWLGVGAGPHRREGTVASFHRITQSSVPSAAACLSCIIYVAGNVSGIQSMEIGLRDDFQDGCSQGDTTKCLGSTFTAYRGYEVTEGAGFVSKFSLSENLD